MLSISKDGDFIASLAACSKAALSGLCLEAVHHITTTSGSTFLAVFLMQSMCWHVGCNKYQ